MDQDFNIYLKDPEFIKKLNLNFICKKNDRLYCRACCKNITYFNEHFKDEHNAKVLDIYLHIAYRTVPPPNKHHLSKLDSFLMDCYKSTILDKDAIKSIHVIIDDLKLHMCQVLKRNIDLRLFGSVFSGFSTKKSNINLEIIDDTINITRKDDIQMIENIKSHFSSMYKVKSTNEFIDGSPNFNIFIDNFVFEIVPNTSTRYYTSKLIYLYSIIDERVKIIGVCLRRWADHCKFNSPNKGAWPSYALDIMLIHFLQHTLPPVLPCFNEELQDFDITDPQIEMKVIQCKKNLTPNTLSVAELWCNLFRYYISVFDSSRSVVSITSYDKRHERKFGRQIPHIIVIEDPFSNSNLSKFIGHDIIFQRFKKSWFKSFWYYSYHVLDYNKNVKGITYSTSLQSYKGRFKKYLDLYDLVKSKSLIEEFSDLVHVEIIPSPGYQFNIDVTKDKVCKPFGCSDFCSLCRKRRHTKEECLLNVLPPVVPLQCKSDPSLYSIYIKRLDNFCNSIYEKTKISFVEEAHHNTILKNVEAMVKDLYPSAKLQLYGSSRNGFGAKNCDLDMCMTIVDSNKSKNNYFVTNIINGVAKHIKRYPNFEGVLSITTARIPIVKFTYKISDLKFDCDLSLSNTFALHNTRLLQTYCRIDKRVSKLGVLVKKIAKFCDICDSSKKTLSSYAYILMTIHYLQNTYPPVLPVLQEINVKNRPIKEEKFHNSKFDVWFFEDIEQLSKYCFYEESRNTCSVGELLLGFFCYFSETFDWENNVVCINQSKELSKIDKGWSNHLIAIEDPFILDHNLGRGVPNNIAVFILECLRKTRNLYGNQTYFKSLDYFLNGKEMVGRTFPSIRCSLCGFAHYRQEKCPNRALNKENEQRQNKQFRMIRVRNDRPKSTYKPGPRIRNRHYSEDEKRNGKNM